MINLIMWLICVLIFAFVIGTNEEIKLNSVAYWVYTLCFCTALGYLWQY